MGSVIRFGKNIKTLGWVNSHLEILAGGTSWDALDAQQTSWLVLGGLLKIENEKGGG